MKAFILFLFTVLLIAFCSLTMVDYELKTYEIPPVKPTAPKTTAAIGVVQGKLYRIHYDKYFVSDKEGTVIFHPPVLAVQPHFGLWEDSNVHVINIPLWMPVAACVLIIFLVSRLRPSEKKKKLSQWD